MPIIVDGKVNEKSLKRIHKTDTWLNQELIKNSLTLKNVFYAFSKKGHIYIIKKSELN